MSNRALFEGKVRGYWRLKARGASAPMFDSTKWDFSTKNGFAERNAGIVCPRDTCLDTGFHYYRFIGSNAYSKYGEKAVFGNWWFDQDTFNLIYGWSQNNGYTLEYAAQLFFALPDEWGDRGRIASGKLITPLWTWMGEGTVAQGIAGKFTPMQNAKAIQLFIPGGEKEIKPCFDLLDNLYTRDCPKNWFNRLKSS